MGEWSIAFIKLEDNDLTIPFWTAQFRLSLHA